jgi:hypothetical protein
MRWEGYQIQERKAQKLELSGIEVRVTLSRKIELLTPDP